MREFRVTPSGIGGRKVTKIDMLTTVGLFGVLAFAVRQRTREIGIRMALGAQPNRVFALVVGQGLAMAMVGIGIGLLAAVGVTRVLSSLLVGIAPIDPLTFGVVSLLFVVVVSLACYLPARRATLVDPLATLSQE